MSEVSSSSKSILREYFEALLIAVVFVNFARIFVFQAFKIPTGSMVDNLLVGDHIIVNKFVYGAPGPLRGLFAIREVRRGDIVVFRYPRDLDTDFVKRVIGLPGETVLIRNKKVFIDGKRLQEDYVVHKDSMIFPRRRLLPEPQRSRDQFGPFRVPPDQYFVMGDNRDQSNDSRYWGTVSRELIKGRAFLVYWSFKSPAARGTRTPERINELMGAALHFFAWTRWDRTFLIVDSKYHYHEDSSVAP